MHMLFSLWFEYDMSFSQVYLCVLWCGPQVLALFGKAVETLGGRAGGSVSQEDWSLHWVSHLLVSACCLKGCHEATLTHSPTPQRSAPAQGAKHLWAEPPESVVQLSDASSRLLPGILIRATQKGLDSETRIQD